ncbi:hypothetical protein BN2475_750009 [Paraburkholderia ribeironis]|uniref:Uncharacterized protein n=1 Tax=Paraburkholderia ribeironis TaxID=1247936 RepID=A0A1N7SJE6_9BURK|nr:hypothetical protein [Paraburkholderia ribeironis]SIT47496.1 hypothetical protein BN2475_750009 [Paraburkholderia ribeironis]
MPWNFTNRQLDPMTLTVDGAPVEVAGGATVEIAAGPTSIAYHRLNYALVGIWPFPADQSVDARYDGGQNIRVQNPNTGTTAIYHYQEPLR